MLLKSVKIRSIRNGLLLLCTIILSGGIGYWFGQHQLEVNLKSLPALVKVINKTEAGRTKAVDFSLFWQVWQELERSYLRPGDVDYEKMVYGAISGMTSALGDPYTVFLSPRENRQTKENLYGSFFGVGIQIGYKNRQLAVIAPLKDMPAAKAGIMAGDYIIKIKDEAKDIEVETQDITIPEAVSLIRGEKNSKVLLTLFREGMNDTFVKELVREEIVISSVDLEFMNQGEIAYLGLTQFGDRTMEEWEVAVLEIADKRQQLQGIVLDLRDNPGGFLNGAVEFASEFLSEGVVVVQQGRNESQTFKVQPGGKLVGMPLVILVNEGSASASEILAGSLRDRLGVKLVGTQTFGKGTVQESKDLVEGAGIHITTAEWVLPSGTRINGVGLTPDYQVELQDDEAGIDEQLEKAIEILTSAES